MATQAMNRKKRDSAGYNSTNCEDYEDGKLKDKKQKKLGEWTDENND